MSAGCYYTHDHNQEVAYWIVIPERDADENEGKDEDEIADDNQFTRENFWDDVENIMMLELGYRYENKRKFFNGLTVVEFESTHDGNGVVIQIKPRREDELGGALNLFNANFQRIEKRLAKAFNRFYVLAYGTSGYTAAYIPVGKFGKQE